MNKGIITELYPDGSVRSIRKDTTNYLIFIDEDGNVGVNVPIKQEGRLLISGSGIIGPPCSSQKLIVESSGSGAVGITPPLKLIITSDNTIHVEEPIGNSRPMKKLIIKWK